jgi:hypothetical protein
MISWLQGLEGEQADEILLPSAPVLLAAIQSHDQIAGVRYNWAGLLGVT